MGLCQCAGILQVILPMLHIILGVKCSIEQNIMQCSSTLAPITCVWLGPDPIIQDHHSRTKAGWHTWCSRVGFGNCFCAQFLWNIHRIIYKSWCPKHLPSLQLKGIKCRGRSLSQEQKTILPISPAAPGSTESKTTQSSVMAVFTNSLNHRNKDCFLPKTILLSSVCHGGNVNLTSALHTHLLFVLQT